MDPDLKNCLFVPCDSHGLQLLVKDIVEHIPVFKATLEQAQAVVKAFKNAPLQLSFLREYQVQHYQQPVALILSVITRWGTQYRLVNSLIKSKDALQYYAVKHAKEELAFNAHEFLIDSTFWSKHPNPTSLTLRKCFHVEQKYSRTFSIKILFFNQC